MFMKEKEKQKNYFCIVSFFWIPYSSRNILSNFKKISQPSRPMGTGSTISLCHLVWNTDFGDF